MDVGTVERSGHATTRPSRYRVCAHESDETNRVGTHGSSAVSARQDRLKRDGPSSYIAHEISPFLIRGQVDAPRVFYCVEPGAVALLKALVQTL